MSHENNVLTMESLQSPLSVPTHPLSHPITLVIVPEDNLHNDIDLQQIVRTLSTPATSVAVGSQPKSLQAGSVVQEKTSLTSTLSQTPNKISGPSNLSITTSHSLTFNSDPLGSTTVQPVGNLHSHDLSSVIRDRICHPQRPSTRAAYKAKMDKFFRWCTANQVSRTHPTVNDVMTFYHHLFTEGAGLQPRTLNGYTSALTDFFDPSILNLQTSRDLKRLMQSYFRDRPPALHSAPEWDLLKVLGFLSKPPL